jgi:hypothetical protein
MITQEHIRQHLSKVSSGIPPERGQMPAHVWQEFHEYLVDHYERFDEEARTYADSIFDQIEASIEQKIGSLPEGPGKKTLSRKLSMVRGERPPVWVLYLDTPVIENVIKHALGESLPGPVQENTQALHEQIKTLVTAGKLICPEDSFHRQVLQMAGPQSQSREGLNIMRTLSQGLSFKHSQSIEDFQIFRTLRGFIKGDRSVNYGKSWQDAFERETVDAIISAHQSVVFNGVLALSEKPGASVNGQVGLEPRFTSLRVRYNNAFLKNEQQLQQRSTRHLRDLVRLGMRYLSVMEETQKGSLDGFWSDQKIDLSLAVWKHYGGNPEGLEGLVSFFESENFKNVPSIKIKQAIWNALSIKHAEGLKRVTGYADVNILSSVLPYTDIMILGHNMTDVIRDSLGLDSTFDTEIYSMDEHGLIMTALKEIARAD